MCLDGSDGSVANCGDTRLSRGEQDKYSWDLLMGRYALVLRALLSLLFP